MVGPLVKVLDAPPTMPPGDMVRLDARLEGGLILLGAVFFDPLGNRKQAPINGADVVAVQFFWQAAAPPQGDYSISVRLADANGRVAAQQDNASPVLGLYPTSRWSAGEVVGDYYELPLKSLPKDGYRLEVVVYERLAQGFRNLRTLDAVGRPVGEVITVAGGIRASE